MAEEGLTFRATLADGKRLNSSFDLVRRRATTGHIKDKKLLDQKSYEFLQLVQREAEIPNHLFFNLDETAVWLTPNSAYTMARRDFKVVPLIGLEDKRCFTSIITSSASGKLLKPTIIWAGTTTRCHVNDERIIADVHQTHTETKWSNPEVLCEYIRECILPEINKSKKGASIRLRYS